MPASAAIRRLLIANRGEIAIRIARGARELGIVPVGIWSDGDERALFRTRLDADIFVPSYLDAEAIVAAARALHADAVHPGYGFLSEQAGFARLVAAAGLRFVGPPPDAIAAMGSKREAKRLARAAGVPVIPGYDGPEQDDERLRAEAEQIGVPLAIKASAGGGGRGLRVVTDLSGFEDALASARREAKAAFGDDTMLLERYVEQPRHIEFQILGDAYGSLVHLGERECSIQRRHQKVVEEAPSVALDPALRAAMGDAAIAAARAAGYQNAGTVEFLLDAQGAFYFMEMNARLQVEHPVTELVYGVDLVHEQLRITAGEPLRFAQSELTPRGWAIEVRLTAEDPAHAFAPQAGTLDEIEIPAAPGVRVDAGFASGDVVPPLYDALLAKIVVWGADRDAAVARLRRTLDETRIAGLATNLPLLRAIARDGAFAAGRTTTAYLDERLPGFALEARDGAAAARRIAAALLARGDGWRPGGIGVPLAFAVGGRAYRALADATLEGWTLRGDLQGTVALRRAQGAGEITFDARGGTVSVDGAVERWERLAPPSAASAGDAAAAGSGDVRAPMPGKVVAVAAESGAQVAAHDLLLVLEAMKMEHRIEAPIAGRVAEVKVRPGETVAAGAALVTIAP